MKKETYMQVLGLAVLALAVGEFNIFKDHAYYGLAIHIINLQIITLAITFGNYPSEIKNALQSLLLLLIMRIINLSMPHFFTATLLWYPLVYGVIFLPVFYVIKNQQISDEEIGINSRRLYIYLPAAILIGIAMALPEYSILHTKSLIQNIRLPNIILITTIMFSFVGAAEELIFRSILQTRFEKVLGLKYGLLLSAILFGIMHSGYGIMSEILFASFFGVIIGYIFQKTRSFLFILTVHSIANVFLFGILPILVA